MARTFTVSLTYVVSYLRGLSHSLGKHRSRQLLLAVSFAMVPQVAPNLAKALSSARSHGSMSSGRTRTWPSSMYHSSTAAGIRGDRSRGYVA